MTEHVDTTRQQFERKIRDRVFSLPARPAEPPNPAPHAHETTA
jgi:hypothetical protein